MPRNRSEKTPTLEGVHPEIVLVLIDDAFGLHRGGETAERVRSGDARWSHIDGGLRFTRLSMEIRSEWRTIDPDVKRAFVADYMEYLHAA